jgi:hypothetical protein
MKNTNYPERRKDNKHANCKRHRYNGAAKPTISLTKSGLLVMIIIILRVTVSV